MRWTTKVTAAVIVVLTLGAGVAFAATQMTSSGGTNVCVNDTNGLMRVGSTCREGEHALTIGGGSDVRATQQGTFTVSWGRNECGESPAADGREHLRTLSAQLARHRPGARSHRGGERSDDGRIRQRTGQSGQPDVGSHRPAQLRWHAPGSSGIPSKSSYTGTTRHGNRDRYLGRGNRDAHPWWSRRRDRENLHVPVASGRNAELTRGRLTAEALRGSGTRLQPA